ncbi:MAG: HNH endonuclease [Leptolyngbya sp. SIO4C1]|nr:HNH endonuclease [Leptolyngbya sp. SIO4C1]
MSKPRAHKIKTDRPLACSRCNQRRYNFMNGKDTQTDLIAALFNPRQQVWVEHFAWSADKIRLVGTTPTGRATCDRLDVNDDRYKGEHPITEARALWLSVGWHPPKDDPIQTAAQ